SIGTMKIFNFFEYDFCINIIKQKKYLFLGNFQISIKKENIIKQFGLIIIKIIVLLFDF
ncbi:MAG: hypothetical protein ACJAUH_001905, partial [Saprospiraceae bacterium]